MCDQIDYVKGKFESVTGNLALTCCYRLLCYITFVVGITVKWTFSFSEICLLSDDIYDYRFVSQGKVTVPSIDDKEDMQFTHVGIHQCRGNTMTDENIDRLQILYAVVQTVDSFENCSWLYPLSIHLYTQCVLLKLMHVCS